MEIWNSSQLYGSESSRTTEIFLLLCAIVFINKHIKHTKKERFSRHIISDSEVFLTMRIKMPNVEK